MKPERGLEVVVRQDFKPRPTCTLRTTSKDEARQEVSRLLALPPRYQITAVEIRDGDTLVERFTPPPERESSAGG